MPTVVNFLPKLRRYSAKIPTTALAPQGTACSDTTWLHFAFALTLLPPLLCSVALVRCYIHYVLIPVMERKAGRLELLHRSGQQGSVGLWGGLCCGCRSHKVGWSGRKAPSCYSLLQRVIFSQASDQLASHHKGEEREKFPTHMDHLWEVHWFCLKELIASRQLVISWYCVLALLLGKIQMLLPVHYFLVPGRQHSAHDRKKTSDSSMEKSPGPIFPIQEREILAWLPDITAPEKCFCMLQKSRHWHSSARGMLFSMWRWTASLFSSNAGTFWDIPVDVVHGK